MAVVSWGGGTEAIFRLVCKSYMTCSFFLFPFLLEDNIPNLCWLGYILSIVFSYVLEDYRQIGANVGGKQLR